MTAPTYGPIELAVKNWLLTTSVVDLTPIYMAMPKSAPVPVLTLTLIGGGPLRRADLPLSRYRLTFDCVGKSRDQASLIARTLITELENLGRDHTGLVVDGVQLGGADVLNMRWQPDPDSDIPRYIVDALITTVL